MNYSAWNSLSLRRRNPALSPGHISVLSEGTQRGKIFAHKLGSVDFSARRDVNAERQNVIDTEIGNLDLNGFKYKNVGHVYSQDVVSPQSVGAQSYPIYAHGHPLGGTEHGGMESCSRSGLQCKNGEGTDSLCNPGKCVIGSVERINEGKWKYVSANTYGSPARPVIYYFKADTSAVLKTVLRGHFITYASDGSSYKIPVDKPASVASRIYLPPKFYYSDDFIDSAIIRVDERLRSSGVSGLRPDVIGLEDRKEAFIRSTVIFAYPGRSEKYLNEVLYTSASDELRLALIEEFAGLDKKWRGMCNGIIEEIFAYRLALSYNGLEFISAVYDEIKQLFGSIIQEVSSSLSVPSISYDKEKISRPVYSRLPGLAESYRSDPAFSNVETPAQWLTSGVDEFLSSKKDSVARFYAEYLDPDTCNPALLDWLAQHVGLFGELWNPLWSNDIKRALIRNSFGWWDRELTTELPSLGEILTPKGEALEQFPFTQSEWVTSSPNLLSLKLDEVEEINVTSGSVVPGPRLKTKSYSSATQKVSLVPVSNVRVDKSQWNGMVEAKGSLLGSVFLCSAFGLKGHSSEELSLVDQERGIFKVRSGLRSAEVSAPLLVPYKQDVLQVGGTIDASVNNYANQLIAGVSRVVTKDDSRNVFFRVPYYYNRDGKSWDRVSYIAKNWMPSNLNVRVQYAHLAAGLWAVGDAFFEPRVIDETLNQYKLILTESGTSYLTTESGVPLSY